MGELEEHNSCLLISKRFCPDIVYKSQFTSNISAKCDVNRTKMTIIQERVENVVPAAVGVSVCPEWTHEWTRFLHPLLEF